MSADTQARPRASSLSRSRPTTPLRRISSSSLRQLSLSHSRSRASGALGEAEAPLAHLSPLFAEMADSVADLVGKFEELALVNEALGGWNEAFAGWLYGLRVNTYTAEFLEAPTKLNFDLAAQRRPPSPPAHFQPSPSPSPPASPSQQSHAGDLSAHRGGAGEMTMDSEHSFAVHHGATGRGRGAAPGRGTRGRGRGRGASTAMTRRKREEMTAFTDSLIGLLPIKYREQQPLRSETERVCLRLRDEVGGIGMGDLTSTLSPPIQQHKVNDILTALVRAKAVLKIFSQGATTYRFDPNKFPPASA